MHITNKISTIFGRFSKLEFPQIIQTFINKIYIKIFNLDMTEFKEANDYKSLNLLFTRALNIKRDINEEKNTFISPCDSLISQSGIVENNTIFQIKDMPYNIEELLTYHCTNNLPKLSSGNYMNFYLSPKDYHRYHSPVDFKINKLIHVPGKLYPVNLKYLNKEIDLFNQNERVILECISNKKIFYMIFIGALNVGQMIFNFEPKVETNTNSEDIKIYTYEDLHINKADEIGYFKMGSTIVMIWEKGFVTLAKKSNDIIKGKINNRKFFIFINLDNLPFFQILISLEYK